MVRNYTERLNIDFHLVETCSPYKTKHDDGRIYTVYTLRIVNGPKPPEKQTHKSKKHKKLYGTTRT